jgi:hypothetical protein
MTDLDRQAPSLSDDDRRQLQAWLTEFEREWNERSLAVRAAQLPLLDKSLRLALLTGLVQIDLRRRWQQGQPATVESYVEAYPELGTPGTVAELIVEEYEARRQHGAPIDRAEFARRFPGRTEQLWQHLEQTRELAAPADAELSTQAHLPPADASTPLRSKTPAALPEQFGRYRIIRQLGRGGMGTVYLAHDTQLDRRVALKVPHFVADDSTALERFYREARVAATLDHPNLCPIHDAGQHEGVPYLTMPYIEGKPLSELLAAGLLPQRQAAALVRQLALALEEAHRRGILHRDLKPSNIMMNRRGEPVVMDFGLARQTNSGDLRLTQSGALLGTPAYMPPEQVDGATLLGPTCDVYSLGVILYEMLTGRLPFQGGTTQVLCQILRDEPRRPSAYRPDLDPRLETICREAMAKRIKERYRSMADLAVALEQFLRTPEAPTLPPIELPPPQEAQPVLPVPVRKGRGQSKPNSAAAGPEPLLDVLPAEPLPVTARRRRRWPKVLLGCLSALLFFCGGPILLLMFLAPKAGEKIKEGWQWVGGEMTRQIEWNNLAMRWKAPPPDADPQELFPDRLGEYARGDLDTGIPLAEYNLDSKGRKATYRCREGEVEVYALRASSLERKAIFKRLLDGIEKRPNTRRIMQGTADSDRLVFSISPPDERGVLWWNQGWLFIAFSRDAVDVEALLRTYLDRISREPKKK